MYPIKKFICILLILIFCLSSFTACLSSETKDAAAETENGAQVGTSSEAKQTETLADKKSISGEITFWTAWADDAGPLTWIEQFNELYPNIKVSHVKFANSDEGNIKIDTALLAGQEIDVFFNYAVQRVVPRTEKNLLYDLTEFIERDGINMQEEFGDNLYQYNGKYYSLPIGSLNTSIYINKNMLDENNIEIPENWTIDEYKEIAKKLTKGEGANKIYGSCDFHTTFYWTMPARGALGSDAWYNEEGLSNFDHIAYKKALQFKYDMENVEKVQIPLMDLKSTKIQAADVLVQGKAAMVLSTVYVARYLKDIDKYPRDFVVTMVPIPVPDKNQENNYNKGLYVFDFLSMAAKTKDKEAAWEFMKWLGMEGSKNIAEVGHIPTWKKTNKDEIVKIMLGDAKLVDVEAFKRVVLDYDSPGYNDLNVTAYNQLYTILQEEAEKALIGQCSVDEALSNMKKRCDEAILKEKGN